MSSDRLAREQLARRILATVAAALVVSGCDKDPISIDHDIAARTIGRDLTVPTMASLIGRAAIDVGVTQQNGVALAGLWADYQRLAYAAAHNDTLRTEIQAAIAPVVASFRVSKFLEMNRPPRSDSATEAAYNSAAHGLYGLRHMVFSFPVNATAVQRDSVLSRAKSMRTTLTTANFAEMARKYSTDKPSAAKGGYLGVFPRATLNPAVAAVLPSLELGVISDPIAATYGVDIVVRAPWSEAKADFVKAFDQAVSRTVDSTRIEQMALKTDIKVVGGGASAARAGASNPPEGSRDTTVIATFDRGGKVTVADMMRWINLMEPGQRSQVLRNLPDLPDARAGLFIRGIAMRSVALRSADSARTVLPDSVAANLSARFLQEVLAAWQAIGVTSAQLADSAKTVEEREKLASARANHFLQRGMMGGGALPTTPVTVQAALDAKYRVVLSPEAIRRAVARAATIRGAKSVGTTPQP